MKMESSAVMSFPVGHLPLGCKVNLWQHTPGGAPTIEITAIAETPEIARDRFQETKEILIKALNG